MKLFIARLYIPRWRNFFESRLRERLLLLPGFFLLREGEMTVSGKPYSRECLYWSFLLVTLITAASTCVRSIIKKLTRHCVGTQKVTVHIFTHIDPTISRWFYIFAKLTK